MDTTAITGLRAAPDESSESLDLFSDDEWDGRMRLAVSPALRPVIVAQGRIDSFNDLTTEINALISSIKVTGIPSLDNFVYCFIPEHAVPPDLSRYLSSFVADTSNEEAFNGIISWDTSEFPDTIVAQIALLKFFRDQSEDLSSYASLKIDSRVLSLVHYALAKGEDDRVVLYFLMKSLRYLIKSPCVAPVAKIFPDYNMVSLLEKLCKTMIRVFPGNVLVSCLIQNLIDAVPSAHEVLSVLSPVEESDSFDSDFFDNLEETRRMGVASSEACVSSVTNLAMNPMCNDSPVSQRRQVLLPNPPKMVTFLLEDGSHEMSHKQFDAWVSSVRYIRQDIIQPTGDSRPIKVTEERSYGTSPSLRGMIGLSGTQDENMNETVDAFFDMVQDVDSFRTLRQKIPAQVSSHFLPLYYAVLHSVNLKRDIAETSGAFYTMLIRVEKDAHDALKSENSEGIVRTMQYFKEHILRIKDQLPEDNLPMKSLRVKRPQPQLVGVQPDSFVPAMAAVDYEMLYSGRSPLSLARLRDGVPVIEEDAWLANRANRAKLLWWLYSTQSFSPYIAFRLAFALTVNIADSSPDTACNLIYEGIYTLLCQVPGKKLPCVNAALLLFGETLERVDMYYYAVMVLDNFLLTDTKNTTYTSDIARMAQRNRDILRALFHYNQSLKGFIASMSADSAVYLGQIISTIYTECGLYRPAMATLTYLLHETFQIPISAKREKLEAEQFGSVKRPKTNSKVRLSASIFRPSASNVSTTLSGVSLAVIFAKLRLFNRAHELLTSVQESCTIRALNKMFAYTRLWVAYRQNDVVRIQTDAPKEFTRERPRVGAFVAAGANFDSTIAYTRLMARFYLRRGEYQLAIFWSEMFIHICHNRATKEVGAGLLMRGYALLEALENCADPVSMAVAVPEHIGKWVVTKKLSRSELAGEALSTVAAAIVCFSRSGSCRKLTQCRLLCADIMLEYGCDVAREPEMFTNAVGYECAKVTSGDNLKFDLQSLGSEIDSVAGQMMHPLLLIHSEVVEARIEFQRGRHEEAKVVYDFALENFSRLFVCGAEFIVRDLTLGKLRYVFNLVRRLCDVLMKFDAPYINDRLYIFDVMNSVHMLLIQSLRTKLDDADIPVIPSTDLPRAVHFLETVKYPAFVPLLVKNGFLDPDGAMENQGIDGQLSMINSLVKLFELQKISEDDMSGRNRRISRNIELWAEDQRSQNSSQLPTETTFSYLVKCNARYTDGIVFVQKLYTNILVYIPSTGIKKYIASTPSNASDMKTFQFQKTDMSFTNSTGLLPDEFVKFMIQLLSVEKKFRGVTDKIHRSEMLALTTKALFGNFGSLHRRHMDVLEDTEVIKSSAFFAKVAKGRLYTMDPGSRAIVIVPSIDVNFIPFETLFPMSLVIRCRDYLSIFPHTNVVGSAPVVPHLYWNGIDESTVGLRRAADCTSRLLKTFCAADFSEPYSGPVKTITVPTQFLTRSSEAKLVRRFEFCSFRDVMKFEVPRLSNMSSLLIFTYTDLCDMNDFVYTLIKGYRMSFFLFIPATVLDAALEEMRSIYKRHSRRAEAVDPNAIKSGPLRDTFTFVTTLKITLERNLAMPIPLIAPIH